MRPGVALSRLHPSQERNGQKFFGREEENKKKIISTHAAGLSGGREAGNNAHIIFHPSPTSSPSNAKANNRQLRGKNQVENN